LIVTDNGSKELNFIKDIKENLRNDNLNPKIFSNISPNPKDEEIMLGKSEFLSGNHDGIIAIGGGSGMDGGKAI